MLEAPPVEAPVEEEGGPESESEPAGQRYARPQPWDHSIEANIARNRIRANAERVRREEERPIAVLARGGQAPDFVTEHGTRRYASVGGPGGDVSIDVRVRHFHVLDAIEHAVGRATAEDDLQLIVDTYLPLVGLLNRGINITQRRRRPVILPPLPQLYIDAPVYGSDFDPDGRERIKVLEAALSQRARKVPALAQSRLAPTGARRRGGCRIEPMQPLGDDPMSTLYCHLATGNPYSYRITIESVNGATSAINRWAEIDSLRGNTWYECKCGYEALLTGRARGDAVAQAVLAKLDAQVLSHSDIARTCGLEYRYIVSNDRVADILRARWFGNVVIDVVPFEGCD